MTPPRAPPRSSPAPSPLNSATGGVRCTGPCPGFIETPHVLREVAELQALGVDVSEAAIATAQSRIGKPMEVAQATLFLASDEASFVNGTHLFVDSGFTAA